MSSMKQKKFLLAVLLASSIAVTGAVVTSGVKAGSIQTIMGAGKLGGTYSLALNKGAYDGASSAIAARTENNNEVVFNVSDTAKMVASPSNAFLFQTTEAGTYVSNSTKLTGVSSVRVNGTSSNGEARVKVYFHFASQLGKTDVGNNVVVGNLNEAIDVEPANYITIEFLGLDTVESIQLSYSCEAPNKYAAEGGTRVALTQMDTVPGRYTGVIKIPTDRPLGTFADVSLKLGVAELGSKDDRVLSLAVANKGLWPTTPKNPNTTTLLDSATIVGATDWINVQTTAEVINEEYIDFKGNGGSSAKVGDGSQNYFLVYVNEARAGDVFYYKDVAIDADVVGSPIGKLCGTNFLSSYYGIAAPEGCQEGDVVKVSFKAKKTATIDTEYANLVLHDKSTIKWGGGAYTDGLHAVALASGSSIPTDYVEYTAYTRVYNYGNIGHGSTGQSNPFDASIYGLCALVSFYNYRDSSAATANYVGSSPLMLKDISIVKSEQMTNSAKFDASTHVSLYSAIKVGAGYAEGDKVTVKMTAKFEGTAATQAESGHWGFYAFDRTATSAWISGDGWLLDAAHSTNINNKDWTEGWKTFEFTTWVYDWSTTCNAVRYNTASTKASTEGYGLCVLLSAIRMIPDDNLAIYYTVDSIAKAA